MLIQNTFKPKQKAERWVSSLVLIGCVLITVGLVYLAMTASALGEGWVSERAGYDEYDLSS